MKVWLSFLSLICLSEAVCNKGRTLNAGTVQAVCDVDAFLCRNELLFKSQEEPLFMMGFGPPVVERKEAQVNPIRRVENNDVPMPIGQILDDIIDFTLNFPPPPSHGMFVSNPQQGMFVSLEIQPPRTQIMNFDTFVMDRVMDDMLSSFFETAQDFRPEMQVSNLAHAVAMHGEQMLQQSPDDENRRRLARRLTSVNPPTFNSNAPSFPTIFDKGVDSCLSRRLHAQTLISDQCAASLKSLSTMNVHAQMAHASPGVFEDLLVFNVHLIIVASCIFLFVSLLRKAQLRRSIINAIYSNPAIRAQVESEIEQDMGTNPPFLCASSSENHSCLDDFCYSLPLLALTAILCLTSLMNPEIVMLVGLPVMAVVSFYLVLKTLFCGCDFDDEVDEENSFDYRICESNDDCRKISTDDEIPKEAEGVYVAVPAVI